MSDGGPSFYARVSGQLLALVIELADRLTLQEQAWAHEYIDAHELGLAVEMIADWLSEDSRPITVAEQETMRSLADEMGVGDRVARALASCPITQDGC